MPKATKKKEGRKKGTRGHASSSEEEVDDPTLWALPVQPKSKKQKEKNKDKELDATENVQVESSIQESGPTKVNVPFNQKGNGKGRGHESDDDDNLIASMPLPSALKREAIGSKSASSLSNSASNNENSKYSKMKDEGFLDVDDDDDDNEELYNEEAGEDENNNDAEDPDNAKEEDEDDSNAFVAKPVIRFDALVSDSDSEAGGGEDQGASGGEDNELESNPADDSIEEFSIDPRDVIYHPRLCDESETSNLVQFLSDVSGDLKALPGVDSDILKVLENNKISSFYQLIGHFMMFKSESSTVPLIESFWIWIRNLFFGDKSSLENEQDCSLISRLAIISRAIAFKTDILVGSEFYNEDSYLDIEPPVIKPAIRGSKAAQRITNNDPINNVPQSPIASYSEARIYLNKCENICIDMCSVGGLPVAREQLKGVCGLANTSGDFRKEALDDYYFFEAIVKTFEHVSAECNLLGSDEDAADKDKEENELVVALTPVIEIYIELLTSLYFIPNQNSANSPSTFRQHSIVESIPIGSHSQLCQSLVDILSLFRHSAIISESICRLLSYLSYNNNENRITLGDSGLCEVLIEILTLHNRNSPSVAESASRAIGNICANDENKKKIGKFGTCKLLSQVVSVHKQSPSVIESACLAICNLSYKSEGNQLKFGQCGCCELLVETLVVHQNSLFVAEQICRSIANLAFNPKNKTNFKRVGAASVLSEFSNRYPGAEIVPAREALKRVVG